ncbi:MAG: 3-deoxy-7-phosphoheptulonate synthase, partial [Sulfurovum sp.]|nr:3-deoxy-7-phosphoheptulonate synthase [Sulfurovum sp.]
MINNLHIRQISPLLSPGELKNKYPTTEKTNSLVSESREAIKRILKREDSRFMAIVGPCSIHNRDAALEYAEKLKVLSEKVKDQIFIVMRIYFEKPRTTVGWRGMILDPDMDGTYDIEKGIEIARRLLKDICEIGVPAGSEMLDPIIPQYISDLLSWAAIG